MTRIIDARGVDLAEKGALALNPFDARACHHGDPCVYCQTPHDDVPPGPCMSHPVSLAQTLRDYATDIRDGYFIAPKATSPIGLRKMASDDAERVSKFLDLVDTLAKATGGAK